MNSKLLIGIAVIVFVVLGIFVLGGNTNQSQTPQIPAVPTQVQNQQQLQTTTVTVDNSGFSPATIVVKSGERVVWANKTGSDISVNSDEHPTHRLFRELNLGHVPNGSNASLVFDNAGTYTYHDHYNPSRTGTVVVE